MFALLGTANDSGAVVIGAIITGAGGLLIAIATWALTRWREEVRHGKQRALFLDGSPAVEGITDGVQPAALRVRGTEVQLASVLRRLDQGEIRFGRIETQLVDIANGVNVLLKKLSRNGDDTNEPGELLFRMAQAAGKVIPDAQAGYIDGTGQKVMPSQE
jgi:hypothetical protein